jgi:microcystin-dependent protein
MQPASPQFITATDNRQPYLVLNYCIALSGYFPTRTDATPFLSQVQLFPFSFAPQGWDFCNGQLYPINQYTALFALIGTQFGGNGTTNFALPDLRGRVPVNYGQGSGLSNYNIGDKGGIESSTISK